SAAVRPSPLRFGFGANGVDVLVTATAEAHEDYPVMPALCCHLPRHMHRMRRLERGDDPLLTARVVERRECLRVCGRHVAYTSAVAQRAVLGPDTRVIEPGADRVRCQHLSIVILHQVAVRPVQHPGTTARQRRSMRPRLETTAGGLDADQLDGIVEKRCKD